MELDTRKNEARADLKEQDISIEVSRLSAGNESSFLTLSPSCRSC